MEEQSIDIPETINDGYGVFGDVVKGFIPEGIVKAEYP